MTSKMQWEKANITWTGRKIFHGIGSVSELRTKIPWFERRSFVINGGENSYLDLVIRKPLTKDEKPIPVATVSKQYVLIQHHEVLNSLEKALEAIRLDVTWQEAQLWLSTYGEWMCFSLSLPSFGFDPGDGCPIILKVNCINSVDKSAALEIKLSWYRLVCGNGLMYGMGKSRLRKIHHLQFLREEDIVAYLSDSLQDFYLSGDQKLYQKWLYTRLDAGNIEAWANEALAKQWGSNLAARACHIARTGYDGEVEDRSRGGLPSKKRVTSEKAVPGINPPVTNAFHVCQILSWLVGGRKTVEDYLKKLMEISNLMETLLKTAA